MTEPQDGSGWKGAQWVITEHTGLCQFLSYTEKWKNVCLASMYVCHPQMSFEAISSWICTRAFSVSAGDTSLFRV